MEKGFGTRHLVFSPDGKTMYIVGELSSQVNVVRLNENTWNFEDVATYKTITVFGSFPRDFNWDKDEKYLVVANQNTNNATLYRRNSETGNLTPIQKDIPVPEATRVLFEED